MVDLYRNHSQKLDLYTQEMESVTGVDMRKELHDILYTKDHGAEVLYRRVKFENGVPKKCACTLNNRSGETSRDIPCIDCSGLGYYYTDILTRTYINHSQAYSIYKKDKPEGTTNIEYRTSYFEWDFIKNALDDGNNIPNRFDRIMKLNKNLDGDIISPTSINEVFEILSVDPYRLDNNGRIEYYRVRIISIVDKSFLV